MKEYLSKPHTREPEITFYGIKFHSVKQAAKYYGVHSGSLYYEVRKASSQKELDYALYVVLKKYLNTSLKNKNLDYFNGKLNLIDIKYEYQDEIGMAYYTCIFKDGRDEILSNEDLLGMLGCNINRVKEIVNKF